jgi:phosphoserine phosphatase RsbU/P
MRVLLVEDEPIQQLALSSLLERLGNEVVLGGNAHEAKALLERDHRISVVVSDWNMPGGDGLDLCRHVRRLDREAYLYFILLSINLPTAHNQLLAFDAGVDDFLSKPVDTDGLRMRLHVAKRIIEYAGQVRQLESFLPICSYCKRVRDDENYWRQIEDYIRSRTGTSFSHGICPSCADRIMKAEVAAMRGGGEPVLIGVCEHHRGLGV